MFITTYYVIIVKPTFNNLKNVFIVTSIIYVLSLISVNINKIIIIGKSKSLRPNGNNCYGRKKYDQRIFQGLKLVLYA